MFAIKRYKLFIKDSDDNTIDALHIYGESYSEILRRAEEICNTRYNEATKWTVAFDPAREQFGNRNYKF